MSESQNIEWKESWRDEYLKWVCGFANAQGGDGLWLRFPCSTAYQVPDSLVDSATTPKTTPKTTLKITPKTTLKITPKTTLKTTLKITPKTTLKITPKTRENQGENWGENFDSDRRQSLNHHSGTGEPTRNHGKGN